MENILFYGDNLKILRDYISDSSIDLIYLDPPFNSKATYNILFAEKNGSASAAQIKAFEDTWHWDKRAEETYLELIENGPKNVADLVQALRSFLGSNDMMAYLVMMAIRLVELSRVLKPNGGLYLHCDPTASHYLKILLDSVFGYKHFRNEIIWHYGQRTNFHTRHFSRKHDILFFFVKSSQATINPVSQPWKREDFMAHRHDVMVDEKGKEFIWTDGGKPGVRYKRYVTKVLEKGKPLDTVWEIPLLNSAAKERLGYPTQKPEALLERIIKASSNESDVVLDPFCGCGTTIIVAEKLKRRWIGIDITHLAISLMKHRLKDTFGDIEYEVIGEPVDLRSAEALKKEDPYQFQWWALGLVGARPAESEKKKGADKGIDGYIYFHDDPKKLETKKIIIQVKSGHVHVNHIRELNQVVKKQNAQIGVFITLENPTSHMKTEAVSEGYYVSPLGHKYPKIQILTIEELLKGGKIDYPSRALGVDVTFKKAKRHQKKAEQLELVK